MNSAELSNKVVATKTALMAALGEHTDKYLTNMKLWFRCKWTKEEFDFESRKLLNVESIHLHNQFLIAILNKIDAFQAPPPPLQTPRDPQQPGQTATKGGEGMASSSRSRKRKRSSRIYQERVTFEPYDFLDFIIEDNLECIRPPPTIDNSQMVPTQRYSAQELFLPDTGLILGRFLVGAWEMGLTTVDDRVAEYVAMAVQVLLKNIISAIIMKKKHYKTTGEGSFYYDIGAPLKDPTLRNSVTRQKIDDGPLELDKEITSPNFMRRTTEDGIFLSACEDLYPQRSNIITLRDAQRALNDHNLLASHSVYAINMERITQMMH